MPRSLWVIEVLQPKVRGEGNEWVPLTFEPNRSEARVTARFYDTKTGPTRVRRWSPAGR